MRIVSLILITLASYGADLMSGSASSNGVSVDYVTRLEPGSPPLGKHGGG